MRVRFWGTRGSMPVALTWRDLRDRLAQVLVAANGRKLDGIEKAAAFVEQELDFALSHTFGGHSSCVEFETGSDQYFVCDMGSGARPFGAHVLARQSGRPATVNVFMSHMHWDHIMGFPFFGPAYVPGTKLRIYGCHSDLEHALRRQQEPPSFPVPFSQLSASFFTAAIWHSSTPTTLLEWPQSSLTDTASASEYIASKITRSAPRKNATIRCVSRMSSSLCSESVL